MAKKGEKQSEETKRKISESEKGKFVSQETRDKISIAKTGIKRHFSAKHRKNISLIHTGKKLSKSHRVCLSESHKGIYSGENHPNWKGGIGRESYPFGFNNLLKEQVRNRDGNKCKLCGVPQIECIKKLSIHHIDYNKKNLTPENLITLCISCNTKVNSNREYWENYFKGRVV